MIRFLGDSTIKEIDYLGNSVQKVYASYSGSQRLVWFDQPTFILSNTGGETDNLFLCDNSTYFAPSCYSGEWGERFSQWWRGADSGQAIQPFTKLISWSSDGSEASGWRPFEFNLSKMCYPYAVQPDDDRFVTTYVYPYDDDPEASAVSFKATLYSSIAGKEMTDADCKLMLKDGVYHFIVPDEMASVTKAGYMTVKTGFVKSFKLDICIWPVSDTNCNYKRPTS